MIEIEQEFLDGALDVLVKLGSAVANLERALRAAGAEGMQSEDWREFLDNHPELDAEDG